MRHSKKADGFPKGFRSVKLHKLNRITTFQDNISEMHRHQTLIKRNL